MFFNVFQRVLDVVIVLISLPFWLPVLMLFCICNFLVIGKPIFFIQERVGKKGKIFNLLKLRSMSNDFELEEKDRISPYGKFIRRTSADELPQLFNVLKGDVSLVGPRPLPKKLLHGQLSQAQLKKRASLKPGLTGYSQVNSKGVKRELHDKYKLDEMYIENASVYLYFYILVMTIKVLFIRFFNNKSGETL